MRFLVSAFLDPMKRLPLPIVAVLLLLAVLAAVWDLRTRRIPNWLVLAGLVAGFGLNGLMEGLSGLSLAGVGMLVAFGVYFVLYLLHAMGAGDVKFMAAIGSLVGVQWWFRIFLVSVILGAIAGVILAVSKGRFRRTVNNVGFIVSEIAHLRPPHLKREDLDVKSEKALRMPHGAAIAAGIFIVMGWAWLNQAI
jgi:prepilin peptidase CpaA